jgi:hypothetical protein
MISKSVNDVITMWDIVEGNANQSSMFDLKNELLGDLIELDVTRITGEEVTVTTTKLPAKERCKRRRRRS